MVKKTLALTLLAAFLAAGLTHAGDEKKQKRGVLKSTEVAAQVEKLTTTVTWHDSVAAARETAAREGKLVLWIHMLGKLDGKT